MARALAVNGARKVYLLGRRLPVLEAAAASHPSVLIPLQCDVTSKPSLQAAVDHITSDTGFLNLVIANSGIIGPTTNRWDPSLSLAELRQKLFVETSMEEMTETFHVNVTGAYFTLLAFLELLDKGNEQAMCGGFGRPSVEGGTAPSVQSQVVVTSSISAFSRNAASTPGYAGSKAAVLHLVKHASSQMARFGIRANAMCPGCEYFLQGGEWVDANGWQCFHLSWRRGSLARGGPRTKSRATRASSRRGTLGRMRRWLAVFCILPVVRERFAMDWRWSMMEAGWRLWGLRIRPGLWKGSMPGVDKGCVTIKTNCIFWCFRRGTIQHWFVC